MTKEGGVKYDFLTTSSSSSMLPSMPMGLPTMVVGCPCPPILPITHRMSAVKMMTVHHNINYVIIVEISMVFCC